MPMVALNGGVIVLPDLSVLDEKTIPDYLLPTLVETTESRGLDVWLYSSTDRFVRSRKAPHVDREASTVQFEPTVIPTFDKVVGVSDDHARIVACQAALQQEFATCVLISVISSQSAALESTRPNLGELR